ncbi:hypothetical protein C7S18_04785 [Ahniella affigens]|uniref:CHAT domain-containing protein n=1 Tax=Ahniella affigens TaxID=2021234 RepID=A0A2P1PP04_9GAMM|nr:tetratricopeptide repeat protein [Ahniella affigens]AVP96557.1 hypothetical protein C7S18_04785 [Ahniella affigens]
MCLQSKLEAVVHKLITLWLLVGGATAAAAVESRVLEVRPGQELTFDLGADESNLDIQWIGGAGPHVLILEQIGADVVVSRNNRLNRQNAPSGRNGPELVLADVPETIQVARKTAEKNPWRLRIISLPVTRRELAGLAAIEEAHQANSSGSARGWEHALKKIRRALGLKATWPPQLALECPVRASEAALARRLKRHSEAIVAYKEATAVCTDDSWRAVIENGLGLTYREMQEFELARAHFDQARTLALASANRYEAASAANNLCLILIHDGAVTEAKACFQRVIKEYWAEGLVTHVAEPLLNLGATAIALGESDLAIKNLKESTDIYQKAGDSKGMAKALMNLSRAQSRSGALQAALKSISDAQSRAESSGEPDLLANIMLIKADLYQQAGDTAALRRYAQDLLEMTKKTPNPRTEALAWVLQASISPAEDALTLLQKAERQWRLTRQPEPLAETLLAISQKALSLNRLDLAVKTAKEALRLAESNGFLTTKADALAALSRLHRASHPKTALKHAQAASALNLTLGRIAEQTENEYLIAVLLKDIGDSLGATKALTNAAGLSVRALAQPLSQRHRRMQAANSVEILSTWTDWLLADRADSEIPNEQSLTPLTTYWSRVNQWRNRTDRLDREAAALLAEWRAKLLVLRDPEQNDASRAALQKRISWLEQQMDLLGNAEAPANPTAAMNLPVGQKTTGSDDVTRIWLLPGEDQVYVLIRDQTGRRALTLPSASTIRDWQARIRETPDKLGLWSDLDEQLEDLRQALAAARNLLVFDPEMLALPWLGLLGDAQGELLVEGRSIRYLQAWTGSEPDELALSPLRLGWPSFQGEQVDPERRAVARVLPDLPIQDDLVASQQSGAWILQVPGHHVIDQNDLAQAVSLARSGNTNLFGPERLDAYKTPPKLVFLNACGGHSGMGGLGLLDLIARPGVKAAIINAWDVPDVAAERFAVRFYEELEKSPDQPAEALSRTQTGFAARFGRRLLREWAGYVLVELAASESATASLRE